MLDYNDDFKSAGQINSLYAPDEFRISDHDIVMVDLDYTPPTVSIVLTPNVLWGPNHKYVMVKATVTVTDDVDPAPTIELVSVTSNEPDNGEEDGDTVNDIVIVNTFKFGLRAERSGIGTGRVYTITYKVTDTYGNSTIQSATVLVPLSMGG